MPDQSQNPDTNKETMTEHKVVCTGLTELTDGKLGVVLQRVVPADRFHPQPGYPDVVIHPDRHVYEEKFAKKAFIRTGGMYSVEFSADFSRARVTQATYVALWPDEKDRIVWQASDTAITVARAANKRRKLDLSSNAIKNALQPLRDVWLNTNYTGRLALEVQILAYLRNGKVIGKDKEE